MTSREELIAEARDAMIEHYVSSPGYDWNWHEMATIGLAVFEEAHAPTDDEQEALATILGEPVRGALALADRILAAGFRRSEVPEPSADHLMQAPAIQAVREVLDQVSDRMDEHAYSEISSALDDIPDCESATAMPHDEHTEPQGEPSDTAVKAAVIALDGQITFDLMRAALRAAAEAERGESRG